MKRAGQGLLVAAALLPMAAWAVTLQYGLRVGDDLRYHEGIAAKGTLQVTTPLGAQTIPVEIHADEQRSLKTISAAAGGTFWLESRSLSAKSTITTPDGQEQQELPGDNFQVRLNRQGEVQEVKELPATQRGDIGLDLKLDSLLNACRLAAFPAGDVQVGASVNNRMLTPA